MSYELINKNMEILFLSKEGDINIAPYNLNRLISFTTGSLPTAILMNKYTFYIDPSLFKTTVKLILGGRSRLPNINYIKSNKEKALQFDFLFKRIQQQFSYSDQDLEFVKPLYLKLFNDTEILKKFFLYYGVNRQYWKKFGLKFSNKKLEKPKEKQKWW